MFFEIKITNPNMYLQIFINKKYNFKFALYSLTEHSIYIIALAQPNVKQI